MADVNKGDTVIYNPLPAESDILGVNPVEALVTSVDDFGEPRKVSLWFHTLEAPLGKGPYYDGTALGDALNGGTEGPSPSVTIGVGAGEAGATASATAAADATTNASQQAQGDERVIPGQDFDGGIFWSSVPGSMAIDTGSKLRTATVRVSLARAFVREFALDCTDVADALPLRGSMTVRVWSATSAEGADEPALPELTMNTHTNAFPAGGAHRVRIPIVDTLTISTPSGNVTGFVPENSARSYFRIEIESGDTNGSIWEILKLVPII